MVDAVNDAFHEAYGRERDVAAHGPPLFVVVGDVLTVLRRGERRDLTFVPPLSHVIKSAAHAPVALYSLLFAAAERDERPALDAFRATLSAAAIPDDDDPAVPDVRAVLSRTAAWADAPTTSRSALDDAARRLGPLLLRLTDHATRLQLARLDACVGEVLAAFDAGERAALTVVVTGDHQARARSLAMQYFGKRLGEGSEGIERVLYAEGVSSVEEAVRLVGTQRFDAVVARAFFGDPARLQRDVLGDAVASQLADRDFTPID